MPPHPLPDPGLPPCPAFSGVQNNFASPILFRMFANNNQSVIIMKNIIKQAIRPLVALVFIFHIQGIAFAQNAIYEIPSLDSKKSIVREYLGNRYIVYNSGSTGNSFNLVDLSTLTVKSLDMSVVDVTDFEIYGDYVYFCGNVSSPLIGWFDIPSAFSGTSQVYFGYLPSLPCSNYPLENDSFLNVKKIEVMNIGGSIHLLIVGDATCTGATAIQARYFADVFFDGSNWMMEATLEHSGILYYDDVAVTDNYVVPVGHKNQANGEYIYALAKPTAPYFGLFSANTTFPPTYSITLYAYGGFSCYIVDGSSEIIIDHIYGDKFATACYGQCMPSGGSSYVSGTVFNLYNGVSLVNSRYCVAPYNNIYGDMRYNPHTNSVYLLPGEGSALPNEYLEFFLDATYTYVPGIQIHRDLTKTKYHSLDACIKTFGHGQAVLSGNEKKLRLWRHNPVGELVCSESYSPSIDIETCGQQNVSNHTYYYDYGNVPIGSFAPTLINKKITKICIESE